MIVWSQAALRDMVRIQDVTFERYGFDATLEVDSQNRAAIETLPYPMNLSKPGRLGMGERELLVNIGSKRNEFFVVFTKDGGDSITILNIKHALEKYPK
ncbi:MAG: hypothetical protein RL748_193 [Pseudomonadota bacterium]|jgi:plasmid stabilization system protein ParE